MTMQNAQKLKGYQQDYSSELGEKLKNQGLGLAGIKDRDAYVAGMKQVTGEGREKIRKIHLQGATGAETVHRITAWTDVVLMELFDFACRASSLSKDEAPCVLLAIGGYGRGELNPFSDLDVMFLTKGEVDPVSRAVSETCLYLMWDLGLDVGHSIRGILDCVKLSESDIRAKTSLIESRFLVGNRDVYTAFLEEYGRRILRRNKDAYLRTKISDVNDRYKKYGGSLYMKEPHVKEGVGGLRDIHTALWIAKVKYGVSTLSELQDKGVVSRKEDKILRRSTEFLWKVRNHLHFLSGRRNDVLTMEMQEETASFLRYKGVQHFLAVERFMRVYYLQTRNVRYFTRLLMNRCLPPSRRTGFPGMAFRRKKVGGGLSIVGDMLCIPDDSRDYFLEEPERLMEIFYSSQRYGLPLADATRQKILSSLRFVNDSFRSSDRVRDLFLQILRSEKHVVRTLREMHELRFLGRYLPEFGALTALVQHELYHAYTVDEHTLLALEKLEGLRGSRYPSERFYSGLFQTIKRPELLYLGVMFHDIGKAMGAGHVDRGAKAIPGMMHRMGLPIGDAQSVELLVRNHLTMAHVSQRRDLHDPNLIVQMALTVKNEEHLKMLTLMTYCDTSCVGPGVWTDWKDTLLKELYEKTRMHLLSKEGRAVEWDMKSHLEKIRREIREEAGPVFGEESTEFILKTLPDAYLLSTPKPRVMKHISMIQRVDREDLVADWSHAQSEGYVELNVCTYDSNTPGLFSRIAGVLAAHRMNILGASVFTSRQGLVIDCVHVEAPVEEQRLSSSVWRDIASDMRDVVQGVRRVEEMLVIHEPPAYLVKKKRYTIPPRVLFDNNVSDQYTVIDVYAEDRIGLLYSITSCLANQAVHIQSSKVTTEAEKAIDAFYVTDIFGHKISDPNKLEQIRKALVQTLRAEAA